MILGDEKMKVKVNSNCIGCGACQSICEEVFEIGDDGFAHVKEEMQGDIPENLQDDVQDALESCPVSAIETQEDGE